MVVSKFKGLDKPTITVVHEIGHIIHERALGDDFWMERTKGSADKTIALKVSQYANTGKKEFVAEVFAGSIIGMKFDANVIKEYNNYGGPQLPK